MLTKTTAYYDASLQNDASARKLILAIGEEEWICIVKDPEQHSVLGFEFFEKEKNTAGWNDIFPELQAQSTLLRGKYRDSECWFLDKEALPIPADRFSVTAAESYLDLLYGENAGAELRYEEAVPGIMLAYRIPRKLHELITRQTILYSPHHIYQVFAKDILQGEIQQPVLRVHLLKHRMLVAVRANGQLQLLQTFVYTGWEDILYHLVHLAEKFSFDRIQSVLQVSGEMEPGSQLHLQLQPLFGLIDFTTIETDGVFQTHTDQPAHRFTLFQKLAV